MQDILHSIGGDVIDRAVVPGQDRVVVAPAAGCGELVQNVLGLMEGHEAHPEQGEAETQTQPAESDSFTSSKQ